MRVILVRVTPGADRADSVDEHMRNFRGRQRSQEPRERGRAAQAAPAGQLPSRDHRLVFRAMPRATLMSLAIRFGEDTCRVAIRIGDSAARPVSAKPGNAGWVVERGTGRRPSRHGRLGCLIALIDDDALGYPEQQTAENSDTQQKHGRIKQDDAGRRSTAAKRQDSSDAR